MSLRAGFENLKVLTPCQVHSLHFVIADLSPQFPASEAMPSSCYHGHLALWNYKPNKPFFV